MKDEIKRFKKTEMKESLNGVLWITIAAAIIMGLSILAKNGTVIFFTIFIYFSLLYFAGKGFFEISDEIKNRVHIKELLKEGQVHIILNCYNSEEITIGWIRDKELYSATLHNSDSYPIKYRQEIKDERCIVDRQIEIDDDLTVTVIG